MVNFFISNNDLKRMLQMTKKSISEEFVIVKHDEEQGKMYRKQALMLRTFSTIMALTGKLDLNSN